MTQQGRNRTFTILMAFGIVFVVCGHLGSDIFTFGGLFPYYGFHVALFAFVSGYFYKPEAAEHPGTYLWGKVKRLLLPYLVWNLLYGLLAALLRGNGFAFGEPVSFRTLFVEPFIGGHQFLLNFPAWFVPCLFLLETGNVLLRRLARVCGLEREWLISLSSLLAGLAVVYLAARGHVWTPYYKAAGRLLFLLPVFEFGQLYRRKLEKKDTMSNFRYFAVVLAIQLFLTVKYVGLAYSVVWCSGFSQNPLVPYLTAFTGIAFWLRVARILTPALGGSRFFQYLGSHTYSVMMHHIGAFFLVKAFWGLCREAGLFGGLCADFDWLRFRTELEYYYVPGGIESLRLVYLAAGVLLPLGAALIFQRIQSAAAKERNETVTPAVD